MLGFNDILRTAGIDPAEVRLVRHQDTRWGSGTSPYSLWRAQDGRLEEYQRIQKNKRFDAGDLLASFVVTPAPRHATLFVGLYTVKAVGAAPEGATDPLSREDVAGLYLYDIEHDSRLDEYVGRLVIDWGGAARTWVQHAARSEKPVLEIRDQQDPPFPGFWKFHCAIEEVPSLYPSWLDVLKNVKGIYLLVDEETGKQYIGSAKGDESLYGRFMRYANDGHGGNIELRALGRRPYQVSILEVVGTSTPDHRIEDIESGWKDKLLTRRFGLNRN